MTYFLGKNPAVREWIEETFGIETLNLARLTIVISPNEVVTVTAELFATEKLLGVTGTPAALSEAEVKQGEVKQGAATDEPFGSFEAGDV